MTVQTKSVPFELKADTDAGTFEALVAVFGNVDSVNDRIVPGAFSKSLGQWAASGDPIPVIFNHDWSDAHAHIGVVEEAKETPGGLLVKGTLDVQDNDVARQVHRLMKRRSLKEFSFGYQIPPGGERKAKDGANELLEVDLFEVGPTLKGANPSTELHAVKSALGVEDPPRDTETQRREAARVEREANDEQLPEVPPAPEPEPEPEPEPAPVPPAAEALRAAAARVEREAEEAQIPDVPETEPEPEPDLAHELQEVKTLLAETRQEVEDLRKKADEADKEPQARSVDPLRRQADLVALEEASDGESLRKSPQPVAYKPPELVPLDELKQRMRDEMLGVLSGGLDE